MSSEVTVLYFAKSAELSGLRSEKLSVRSELTSLQLWQQLEKRHPKLSAVCGHVVLAVNQEYVDLGDHHLSLKGGDEIAVIPPLSGAMAEDRGGPLDLIKLTTDKLSADTVSTLVTCSSCGAISLFIGTTRDNFEGKRVIRLEYEAYEPMAELKLRNICEDIRAKWPTVRHICIHHRLGLVPVTEASVIIGISSPHRADSLDAVTFCIDALKASVPIWKKEIYESEEPCWKENKECLWAGSRGGSSAS